MDNCLRELLALYTRIDCKQSTQKLNLAATSENHLLAGAPNKDSTQYAHPRSLIRKFVVCTITKTCLFNILENLPPKRWKFSDKNSDIFHISAQNIDCGYSLEPPRWGGSNEYPQYPLEPPHRGGSNEYPQYMFLSRNKKNNVYSCKPQFYYIKVGFKGVKII